MTLLCTAERMQVVSQPTALGTLLFSHSQATTSTRLVQLHPDPSVAEGLSYQKPFILLPLSDVSGDGRQFSQIEIFGDSGTNTYECLGIQGGSSNRGQEIQIAKCSTGDQEGTRWSWIGKHGSRILASDTCRSMCDGVENERVVLVPCSDPSANDWLRQ